ncbi:sodium:calcium antiporter [Halococcoides cellulosivorans]|uniref:Sodium:calcium antiporter n=1 Tax=Halococcoides cellulosivorans TaxID=1679096 RepID=A0A2R4X0X1_9EURY|nr:sodium:calcium antiporter [Halococcoides cellulosivorans]AWB27426.1 sodium:calcium antiporter [Halococcoides cellulosivorans]
MALWGLLPATTPVHVALVIAATAVVWVASDGLESSADRLSAHYGLPAVIQGSVVVAVGSSFPELSSVIVTSIKGVFDMGVGAIVGSAIFNVLVIPAVAGIVTDEPVDANRPLVFKEAQFYMLAVAAMAITFALAVIYEPAAGTLVGTITRPIAALPLLLYLLYLFIQYQDVSDHDAGERPDDVRVGYQWAVLAGSLIVILVAVHQLVEGVDGLSQTFGVPEFLAGVTIIAAATSVPDTFVSVRAARAGNGLTSIGNVLGSNTFDLLVAIPIGVLIVGEVTINFGVAVPMLGVLTAATVALFVSLRTDLELSDREAYMLLGIYMVFFTWVVTETIGLTHVLPR